MPTLKIPHPKGFEWRELAELPELASVLDPRDQVGRKNHVIDRVHKHALGRAVNVRGKSVLDFGCGGGRLSAWLCERGATVYGVDVTPEMIAVAESRVPGAHFAIIDGVQLPFSDDVFDLAVSVYVLQYYVSTPDAIHSILAELRRVLKPGGTLVAIEQVTDGSIGHMTDAASDAVGTASKHAYRDAFAESGFEVRSRDLRRSDSRLLSRAVRYPGFCRTPGLAHLLGIEAGLRRPKLANGRYTDSAFVARVASD